MHIRPASLEDLERMVQFECAMLQDMASFGGMPLAESGQVEGELRQHLSDALQSTACLLLVAHPEGEGAGLFGMLDASLQAPEEVFAPRKMMHIHAVYVEPTQRRRGVGRKLVEAALEWGRQNGCLEADLNVLAGNPARELYARLGFEVFEVNLRRGL